MDGINNTYRYLSSHLSELCAFDLVARHGNFTNAAAALGVSQSAISQRIKGLETDLGIVLFRREHRGVRLTNDGKRLLIIIRPAMEQMAEVVASLVRRKSKQQVRLSLDFAFASFWMLPKLGQLREEFDEIDIQILTSQTPVEAAGEDCDLIIHLNDIDEANDDTLLFKEKVIAVCSPEFLAENGPVLSATELLDQPLLSLSGPMAAPWHTWQSWFAALKIKGERTRQFTSLSNYDLVIHAALDGQGIALGWIGLIDEFLADNRLVPATTDVVESGRGYVISRNPRLGSKGLDQIYDWILAQQAEMAPLSLPETANIIFPLTA